jgi:hypothetical protein
VLSNSRACNGCLQRKHYTKTPNVFATWFDAWFDTRQIVQAQNPDDLVPVRAAIESVTLEVIVVDFVEIAHPATLQPQHGLDLEWQTKQLDKAFSVSLIVDIVLIKGDVVLAVQAVRALACGSYDISFVALEPHGSGDVTLR